MEPRGTASQAGEPFPAFPGSCCFSRSLDPSGIICLLAGSGVGCRGVPAQGSSSAQPRLLHAGRQWLQAAAQGRDGEQGCVRGQKEENTTKMGSHCTDVENQSILYPLELLVLEGVLQQREEP